MSSTSRTLWPADEPHPKLTPFQPLVCEWSCTQLAAPDDLPIISPLVFGSMSPVILGAGDEKDETRSVIANEWLSPREINNLHHFGTGPDGASDQHLESSSGMKGSRIMVKTSSTSLLPFSNKNESTTELQAPEAVMTPMQQRPKLSSRNSGVQKSVVALFRRSHSRSSSNKPESFVVEKNDLQNYASSPTLNKEHRQIDLKTVSEPASLNSTRSNTPPTTIADHMPGASTSQQESSRLAFLEAQPMTRLLRAFSFRNSLGKHRVTFVTPDKADKVEFGPLSQRSTSLDPELSVPFTDTQAQLPPRSIWSMAADTGVGLKSRRLSLNLPDNFAVDIIDLYSEFVDQSKLVGRWGKSIGKGATAHVRLMNKKGGQPGEVYAVKEFRGKSSKETAEDHERKVKSEYSIAKSLRHPNIVKTIRLCIHNGKWSQVMEFCEQGDLFGLVSQKYLSKEKHLTDRLCLFKQLIQGLNYLHTHGIAHRDVKLENLLITRDSKLKITDFGVSEVFSDIHPGLRTASGQCGLEMGEVRLCDPGMCGSPPYVAPEVVDRKSKYDPRSLDVWGAAVVMLCMTANGCLWDEARIGNSPSYDDLVNGWDKWNAKHVEDHGVGITEADYPYVPFFDQHVNPPALRRMLLTMLNPDPSKRASIASVANNRWLKHVDCCQLDGYDYATIAIDATQLATVKNIPKSIQHNHLPPASHLGHRLVRLPGTTDT